MSIFQTKSKNIIINIYRIQAYNSIMCGYFCIVFIDFIIKGKSLLEYTSLCFPNEYENNIKIFSIDFKKVRMIKIYCIVCDKYKKLKNPKIPYILKH